MFSRIQPPVRKGTTRRAKVRLCLEVLEDRTVPATVAPFRLLD